jgi:hypothetical protein
MLVPFAPAPGLYGDDTTFSSDGRWVDGNNVRFRGGKPQVVGGWSGYHTLTDAKCVSMATVRDPNGVEYVCYGTDGKLLVAQGTATPIDITPVGLGAGIQRWSIQSFGSTLLAVPVSGTLYENADVAGAVIDATSVAAAPAQITWMLVTPERQVLAFGCNEEVSGAFNPMCIRGSDIEDYADWTTSAANNAFEHILEGPGRIVGARLVGAFVAVWTTHGLHLGQYVGQPGQAYRFDRLDDGCGLIGPDAVCVHDGVAYWLSPDYRLFRWTPGAMPAAMPCPIQEDFRDNVRKSFAAANSMVRAIPHHDEVWIHYPDSRDASSGIRATRYIAVNIRDLSWFRGAMQLSAVLDGRITLASHDAGAYLSADGSALFVQGHGSTANGSALSWHLTSGDHRIDEGGRRMMIRGVRPDFEDQQGDVSLTVFVRDHPQSAALAKGPYTLAEGIAKKDLRASGRLIAVKLSGGAASGSYMRLGTPLFDIVAMGER